MILVGLLFIAVGLQAMLNTVLYGDLQRKFVISQKNLFVEALCSRGIEVSQELNSCGMNVLL